MQLSQAIAKIQEIIKLKHKVNLITKAVYDAWNFNLDITIDGKKYLIKNLEKSDLNSLLKFKDLLGDQSRKLFCPYPWADKTKLKKALITAIHNSEEHIDASYIIKEGKKTIGHFFLWKLLNNPHSKKYGLQIPELGLAIADKYQNKGLGGISVKILQTIGLNSKVDAIELTTDLDNQAGLNIYMGNGFEYIGIIKNPLEVNVTQAINLEVKPEKFRNEKQMIYIINNRKRSKILKYLSEKRKIMDIYYQESKNCNLC